MLKKEKKTKSDRIDHKREKEKRILSRKGSME
jgi:hypothetical protein